MQSIYFEGPEGLNLEICSGSDIDERAWVDPEVSALCGISAGELEALKKPAAFERPSAPAAQPAEPHPDNERAAQFPQRQRMVFAMSDDVVWEKFSETAPPVLPED